MAESRGDRLTRIRAEAVFNVSQDDVLWLLAQVSEDVEYRVEWRGCEGRWREIERCASLGEAMEAVGDNRATAPEFDFRATSAPVRVWTPIEEG